MTILSTAEVISKYGQPADPRNQGTIALPYPMRLAWDTHIVVRSITCHRAVAERLLKIFEQLLAEYTLPEIQRLGIDLYGGCYNNRPKRGAEKEYVEAMHRGDEFLAAQFLSRHAWSIAIDLDPDRNRHHETRNTARFARDEYKDMIAIFYRNGFLNYGREKNFDWMHFEAAY